MKTKKVDYAIVGSGVGGLALADALAKEGAHNLLLLEQEKQIGLHASGQNAGMIRQVVPHPLIGKLTLQGAQFLRHCPSSWKVSFQKRGSFLLAKGKEVASLERAAAFSKKEGLKMEWVSSKKAAQCVPLLEGADFEKALFCPSDGVIDRHALLRGYLKDAQKRGVQIWKEGRVQKIHPTSDGFRLRTSRGLVQTQILINAAGAWAGVIGEMAGGQTIPFRLYRRHLLLSAPHRHIHAHWPFIWDMTHGIYFRPEQGGLLLSPCDQDRLPSGRCPIDAPLAWRRLRKRLGYFPKLPSLTLRKAWGGVRTFSPDDNFCIGWDGKQRNFFWVAGLDGHGMTTSAAVGEFAARLLLGKRVDSNLERGFSPTRFTSSKRRVL